MISIGAKIVLKYVNHVITGDVIKRLEFVCVTWASEENSKSSQTPILPSLNINNQE